MPNPSSNPAKVSTGPALPTPAAPLSLPDLVLEPLAIDAGSSRFDLSLQLGSRDGGLAGRLEYSRDLFDAATAWRLAGQFCS